MSRIVARPPSVCEHGHVVTRVKRGGITRPILTALYNGCGCKVNFSTPLGVPQEDLLSWIRSPSEPSGLDSHTTQGPTQEKNNYTGGLKPSKFYTTHHKKSRPFPYQVEGMEFAESSGYRCLIADEQGLGKTIQSIVPIYHDDEALMPYLIFCQASLLYQYKQEIVDWCGFQYRPHVIRSSKHKPPTFAAGHIVSYQLAKNIPMSYWLKIKPKYLILDECQVIKNPEAQVTQMVQDLVARLHIPHIIATSGTPIKNRPSEFWPILNILRPERFPALSAFRARFCEVDDGKETGMKNMHEFDARTRDFMIRRERRQVYKELPSVNRQFFTTEFSDKERQLFEKALKGFKEVYESYLEGEATRMNCIAALTAMRVIAGWTKVIPVAEKVEEILQTPGKKVAIAGNFKGARAALKSELEKQGFKTLSIEGGMSPEVREKNKLLFNEENDYRVMFLSTLAAGVGLNLQHQCYTVIFMDREWNAANEEQVESRFTRVGSERMNGSIDAIYMHVNAPIDLQLSAMVEEKRVIVREALNRGEPMSMDENLEDALMDRVFNS